MIFLLATLLLTGSSIFESGWKPANKSSLFWMTPSAPGDTVTSINSNLLYMAEIKVENLLPYPAAFQGSFTVQNKMSHGDGADFYGVQVGAGFGSITPLAANDGKPGGPDERIFHVEKSFGMTEFSNLENSNALPFQVANRRGHAVLYTPKIHYHLESVNGQSWPEGHHYPWRITILSQKARAFGIKTDF